MKRLFRLLGVSGVIAIAGLSSAGADSYGTCTSFSGGRKCVATTTQYDCCWAGVAILCPDGNYVYGGVYWGPQGGTQLCSRYNP